MKYLIGLLISFNLYGEEVDYFFTPQCPLTPMGKVIDLPEQFNLSNDLVKYNPPAAEKIYILTGKLLDINCVPIVDAKVNIWYNANMTKAETLENPLTGTAYTNNLGIFNFITRAFNSPIYMQVIVSDISEPFYRTLHITDSMLSQSDLYKMNPNYSSIYPQYKFLWTLNLRNNYLSY